MDKESLAKHDRVVVQSKVNALKFVAKMDLPKVVAISDDSFSGLGLKTTRDACKVLKRLREAHGDKLEHLIGLSLREIWFALFDSSGYVALGIAEGFINDNDYTRKLATAEGYGEIEGIAWTLFGQLSEVVESQQQATFRNGTPFEERSSLEVILNCAAINWFVAAANSYRTGDVLGAFDWLSEAQDALSLSNGNNMWDEGAKLECEPAIENSINFVSQARTALAKIAAQARHTENRSMKSDVFKWLDVHITEFKSMDAAAQAIIKQQPVVFRTARDWVGDWKKLRSPGIP